MAWTYQEWILMDDIKKKDLNEPDKLYADEKRDISNKERAFLIGCSQDKRREEIEEHLKELASLAKTFGFETVHQEPVVLRSIDAGTYLRSGKIEEIQELLKETEAEVVIFDDEIAPNQQRNLEKLFCLPVIDRTELILEIFSKHAKTRESKIQIELATCVYQLPRLRRLWTHLSRQRSGGGGATKGEGERQIELDRRMIKTRMAALRRELKEVRAQRQLQRRARLRNGLAVFGIVGYTNVGKSTLINRLVNCDVLVEDKLFATLDTTTRQFILPNKEKILLVDTVGFIRKIPHTLVDAFKSTLEEAVFTDILIHVIDVSHPAAMSQAEETLKVLKELGVSDKPIITVLNKIDLLDSEQTIIRFKLTFPHVVALSAVEGEGVEKLLDAMIKTLDGCRTKYNLKIPQKEYGIVSKLMERGTVFDLEYEDNDVNLTVDVPNEMKHEIESYIVEDET